MLVIDVINFIAASLLFALAFYFSPLTFLWVWLEGKGIIKWSTIYIIDIVLGILIAICFNKDTSYNNISTNNSKDNVYICTGTKSKRYHKTEDCIGLSKCSRSIEEISIEEAEELGRTPCGYCY